MRYYGRVPKLNDEIELLRDQFATSISKVPRSAVSEDAQVNLIHQYTRLGTVLDILSTSDKYVPSEIWATSIAYMNDTEEFEHARKLFIGLLRSLKHEDTLIVDTWVFDVLEKWATRVNGQSVFCACYSSKSDDLNQWRSYADGARGICLSYDLKKMREAFPQYSGWVIYNERQQKQVIRNIVKHLALTLHSAQDAKDFMQNDTHDGLHRLLSLVFSFLKHPKFEEEAEFRIVYTRRQDEGPLDVFFRAAGTRIQPFVKLTIKKNNSPVRLPLRRITLSPGSRGNANHEALDQLLLKREVEDVEQHNSCIPFLPTT